MAALVGRNETMEKQITKMVAELRTLTQMTPEWHALAERIYAARAAVAATRPAEEFFSVDSGIHRTMPVRYARKARR